LPLLLTIHAAPAVAAEAPPALLPVGQHWVAAWGAAQQLVEPSNMLPAQQWRDASLRQIVHLSLGGRQLRVRFSNAFGSTPLVLDGAAVALAKAPGQAEVEAQSVRPLSFGGQQAVSIPPGAEYYSDVVAMEFKPGADLAVSLYLKAAPAQQTGHPGSRANSFTAAGNRVMDSAWSDAGKVAHWYVVSDVEVAAPRATGALVAIGDSITDGRGATTDGNDRWPDLLAARLQRQAAAGAAPGMARGGAPGVVNAGIGGGRMLLDGLGPNMASRFDRDVLSRSGVTHAVVLIGVNDLGTLKRSGATPAARQLLLADLKLAHRQLAERAHAHGVCLIGATLTPYGSNDYYHPGADDEADRQALNDWIRRSGVFDAVADFDAALRDPAAPQRLAGFADSGDGLHPSPAGFRAMADAVPAAALQQRCEAAR
jgi:lysophospholipase L1-like esterase